MSGTMTKGQWGERRYIINMDGNISATLMPGMQPPSLGGTSCPSTWHIRVLDIHERSAAREVANGMGTTPNSPNR